MTVKSSQLAFLYREVHGNPAFESSRLRGCRFVPGDGAENASVMIVGEAPGEWEDRYQRPFVGASGRLLNSMLSAIGIERDSVFTTNVLKYRLSENVLPLPEEIRIAGNYLALEIEVVDPQVVVLLGRTAINAFIPRVPVYAVHGRPFHRKLRTYLPAYHPAAVLQRPATRELLAEDFSMLERLVRHRMPVASGA